MKEAYLYKKLDKKIVRCFLCNHKCLIKEGAKGICGVRENRRGTLFSLVYEKIIARHMDPIEKKPLFHFLPGSNSYSMAAVGCNFKCLFCQNADISQMPSEHNRIFGEDITPPMIVEDAIVNRSATISYTYTEPTVYFEMAVDTARLATAKGLKNVFVSNGYMTEECLKEIHPDLHGINVDLKSYNDDFYMKKCGAKLEPVLRTLEIIKKMGIWLEVTTLLIPGLNDSDEELESLSGFLADLDPEIPWHISRFHPTYRMTDIHATPADRIHRARDIGKASGLRYLYTGNLPGDNGENTFCHNCGKLLIERFGFNIRKNKIKNGCCSYCNAAIPGIW